jgi:mRNA interferase RelE/StbE
MSLSDICKAMKVEITRKFKKQVESCDNTMIKKKVGIILLEVMNTQSLTEIKGIKKLRTDGSYFRIRVNDYRIGICLKNDTVTFAAFDHRSDIYKYFP